MQLQGYAHFPETFIDVDQHRNRGARKGPHRLIQIRICRLGQIGKRLETQYNIFCPFRGDRGGKNQQLKNAAQCLIDIKQRVSLRRSEHIEFPAHPLDGGAQQPGVHPVRLAPVCMIEFVQPGKEIPVAGTVASQCGG